MINGKFTRQEAMKLTGFTRSQISYLDEIDLIKPEKLPKKVILYNWNQLLELKTLSELRKNISLRKITDAKEYLIEVFNTEKDLFDLFRGKKLVVSNKEIFLIEKDDFKLDFNVSQITGNNKGQYVFYQVLELNNIISELHKDGKILILDYEKQLDKMGKQSHNIRSINSRKIA